MGWFDEKDKINVKEIEHVRGSRILTARPKTDKNPGPGWFDPSDPTTHDLPTKPENYAEVQNQTLTRELVLEDIELPDETATKHLVISGGTGTGKTQAIHRVLDRVLWGAAHGEKAIITDSGGQFFESRSRREDLLINPFDGRSVLWNPFAEIQDDWDFDSLSEALVPDRKTQGGGSEEEWRRYARGMISSIMKALHNLGDSNPRKVANILKNPDPEALRPYLSGTAEEALLAPGMDRFLGSVVTVAGLAIKPWSVLDPAGTFSIRKWVREGGQGSLFITYKDSQRTILKDLIAAWIGIAIREVLDLPPDFSRRVWLVCDELDSLGQVSGIADANTRGRKYGLCSVGAIQSKAQLDATYGPLGAQTLLSTYSSKIAFRQGSWSDAEYWSNEYGQREITEQSITHASTTAIEGSSTETTAQARKIVQTILPSELAELPDRTAYCRFPGISGIHQIEFEIRKYKPIRPAFLSPGEPEPEFEDPKVADVVKKPEVKEEPVRIPWGTVAGGVGLALVLGVIFFPPDWLANPKKETPVAPDANPPQALKYRVYHWTHGTFKCRIDHSTGERPWACVRIGPPKKGKTMKPSVVKKPVPATIRSPFAFPQGYQPGSSDDPTLAVWSGPLPGNIVAWCQAYPKQKWIAFWKPVVGESIRVRALCARARGGK